MRLVLKESAAGCRRILCYNGSSLTMMWRWKQYGGWQNDINEILRVISLPRLLEELRKAGHTEFADSLEITVPADRKREAEERRIKELRAIARQDQREAHQKEREANEERYQQPLARWIDASPGYGDYSTARSPRARLWHHVLSRSFSTYVSSWTAEFSLKVATNKRSLPWKLRVKYPGHPNNPENPGFRWCFEARSFNGICSAFNGFLADQCLSYTWALEAFLYGCKDCSETSPEIASAIALWKAE